VAKKFDIRDVLLLLPVTRGLGEEGLREMQYGCDGKKTIACPCHSSHSQSVYRPMTKNYMILSMFPKFP